MTPEEQTKRRPLDRFFESLTAIEQELLRPYLKSRKLEVLTKSFDDLLAKVVHENKKSDN